MKPLRTIKKGMIHSTFDFLHSAFDSNLIIADFVTFESDIKQVFDSTKNYKGGNVTAYTSFGSSLFYARKKAVVGSINEFFISFHLFKKLRESNFSRPIDKVISKKKTQTPGPFQFARSMASGWPLAIISISSRYSQLLRHF